MDTDLSDVAPADGERCPLCGGGFTCGMQAGPAECWCAQRPPLARGPGAATGCYCPACLTRLAQGDTPAEIVGRG